MNRLKSKLTISIPLPVQYGDIRNQRLISSNNYATKTAKIMMSVLAKVFLPKKIKKTNLSSLIFLEEHCPIHRINNAL